MMETCLLPNNLTCYSYIVLFLLSCIHAVEMSQTVNVALGKPTRQTDNHRHYVSSFAVDGNIDTVFFSGTSTCAHTGSSQNTWWVVDLMALYPVRAIKIYARFHDYRLRDFYVYVSENNPLPNLLDLSEAKPGHLCFWYEDVFPSEGQPVEVPCNPVTVGRYVYFWKPKNDHLNFCEVNVLVDEKFVSGRSAALFVKEGLKSGLGAFDSKLFSLPVRSLKVECVAFCLSESSGNYMATVVQVKTESGLCECVQKSNVLEDNPQDVLEEGWILMELSNN